MKRIESAQNASVKHWKKLATTRKEREQSGEYIIEGFHLVEEALKNKELVKAVIVREGTDLPLLWNTDDIEFIEVTAVIAKELAETENSQGVFAVCKQVEYSDEDIATWTKLLLVDAVQDPGNIGTMIRTADAAGIDAVVLGKGSADLFNAKTLRSAQGSHFHIPVIRGDLMEWVENLRYCGIRVYGTALDEAMEYTDVDAGGNFALIVGNEGSGIHHQLLQQTDANVMIPLYGKAESLNVAVATGILLYAFVR